MNTHEIATRLAAFFLGLALAGLAQPACAVDVAQSPLFLTTSVDPNLMFTLDNSDSMIEEILPDSSANIYSAYLNVYQKPANVYNASDPALNAVSFDDRFAYSRLARSPQFNQLYYNPAITYYPWLYYDGSPFPDAVPSAAYHNPVMTSAGVRNLTVLTTTNGRWDQCHKIGSASSCSAGSPAPLNRLTLHNETYWPAVYYTYTVGNMWNITSYNPIYIMPRGTTYTDTAGVPHRGTNTYTGSAARDDCAAAPTCTYAEEIQNFANWYTYYRSRILAARAGAGRVLANQDEHLRVGFAAVNQGAASIDGVSSSGTLIQGLRPFSGNDRKNFFDILYGVGGLTFSGNTPLQQALDDVGQYFQRTDNQGPWSATPGTNNTTPHLECRQSFNVIATDGYWTPNAARTAAAQANVDGNNGPMITGPSGLSYQYTPAPPYQDAWSGTLADVAMYYWYRDLRLDLVNKVPTSSADLAFWQHLVNFTVGLGVNGTLNPATDLAGLTDGTTSWPDPVASNITTIDDLWHAAVNSRGQFFSAADPVTFANALSKALGAITVHATASASAVATNSSSTVVYQASFDSSDWSGIFQAFAVDPASGNLVDQNGDGIINAQDNIWIAFTQIPAFATRKNQVFTYNATAGAGAAFSWATLSHAQHTALKTLDGVVDPITLGNTRAQQRLNYLLGDQTKENTTANPAGIFRKRTHLLGDIVNSSPVFVGSDDFGYTSLPFAEGSSYTTFLGNIAQRRRMVYVGANDGMLHGFDAGSYNASVTPPGFNMGTGVEQFAYVPNDVFANLSELTSPTYTHRYFVDGSPRVGDAYLGGAWKTVLVGTTGRGGQGVFALDVTAPDSFGANKVLWDVNTAYSPTAADLADVGSTPGFANGLGYTLPQASITRLYDGSWAAIVGNGYGSASNKAVLYIIALADGHLIRAIDTGAGSAGTPNGLSTPIAVDANNDRITDYIYAGDLQGNLWKFDVTAATANGWNIPFSSGGAPAPLFMAKDPGGVPQPITAKPQVGYGPLGSGLMVYFGTGKYFEVGDNIVHTNSSGVVDEQIQTFYGIWDKNTPAASDQVSGRGELQIQTIDSELSQGGFQLRTTSNTTVDIATQKGWYMDLKPSSGPQEGERVVDMALLRGGRIIFTTLIPSSNPCETGGTGWLMEMNALNGQRLGNAGAPWDISGDGKINSLDLVTVAGTAQAPSGIQSSVGILFGPPAVIPCGDNECKKTNSSPAIIDPKTESATSTTGRKSWQQLH